MGLERKLGEDGSHLNELQDKVSVFAVELGGQAVQASAQPLLLDLHQPLAFCTQLHADAKLILPVGGKDSRAVQSGQTRTGRQEE